MIAVSRPTGYVLAIVSALLTTASPAQAGMASIAVQVNNGPVLGTLTAWTNTSIPNTAMAFFGDGPAAAVPARNGQIYDTFTTAAPLRSTLAIYHFDHFQFLNEVVSANQGLPNKPTDPPGQNPNVANPVAVPFIDPLSGGNYGPTLQNAPDDKLPYYWGETAPTANELGGNTVATPNNGITLDFADYPSNVKGTTWTFNTYLVGVYAPVGYVPSAGQTGLFVPLAEISWTFSESPTVAYAAGLQPISGLSLSEVSFATMLPSINRALPGSGFSQFRAVGVPEPSTLVLGSLAILGWCSARGLKRALERGKGSNLPLIGNGGRGDAIGEARAPDGWCES